MSETPAFGEPIAIIGTGCRFPGNSTTPFKLWELLSKPCDLSESIDARFSSKGWFHENGKYHGHLNVTKSYFLSGQGVHRQFDASVFGVNAVEANTMDPQMRLLLETVYEALEAAGQPIESLRGSDTAVYSGMMTNSYKAAMERDLDSIGIYHVSGVSRAMMSNRLSYFFDWHGPSITIDTACSSSLIAVHQAVMQLRTGQSRVAIAAGSNLLLDPADYVAMCNLEMLSPDGRSRMWDKDANGYARGEGVAAVVLKTLSAAEADGDHIECIIRETATNQDGRTSGITMPSATAQAQLIRDCYARAGLDLSDPAQRPGYFEAHGTGTQAGDPVEAEAIQSAFLSPNEDGTSAPLYVGSIKTVIGHSESTAGLAGLIKASLALQNSIVPPNLLFNELNPKLEPHYRGLEIPTSAIPWPRVAKDTPRRASVNSFGFGGANAHAILENYTPPKQPIGVHPPCFTPFVFSAASESSLYSGLASFSKYLRLKDTKVEMRSLALTLHSRRTRHKFRSAIAASRVEDLCQKIELKLQKGVGNTERRSAVRHGKQTVLGVFTGQGAQSARMTAALLEHSPYCCSLIEKLEKRLATLPEADRPSWSLKQQLLTYDHTEIGKAYLSQPLCTALQILHVDLLRAAGIDFSAVVGHSSGEIGAAYCAGMVSAEEAICIAYYRGFHSDLAGGLNGQRGAMMAVGTSFMDAQELCNEDDFHERISVAAINASGSVTVSGDEDAIEEMKVIFEDEGKFVRRLKVDKAYHSSHMIPCSVAYLRALRGLDIRPRKPQASWFSSVDEGRLMTVDDFSRLQADYWNDNMVQPVKFMQAVQEVSKCHGAFDLVVEVGPHPALKGPTIQTIQEIFQQKSPYIGTHLRGESAVESFADALGYMWAHLPHVDLARCDELLSSYSGFVPVVGLPPYAWDHAREFWHESRYAKAVRTRAEQAHELLGHLVPESTDQDMRWRNVLSPKEIPWLKSHALQDQAVFPAAGYVVAAVEAIILMARAGGLSVCLVELLDFNIDKALVFDSDESKTEFVNALTDVRRHGNQLEASFKSSGSSLMEGTSLTLHASGHVRATLGNEDESLLPCREHPELNLSKVETEEMYDSLSRLGYQYTGPFRALSHIQRKFGFATGQIAKQQTRLLIHPAMLDAAFQSLLVAYCAPNSGGIWTLHVPKSIRAIRINPFLCATDTSEPSALTFDCIQPLGAFSLEGDINLYSVADGIQHAMIQVESLHCVSFSRPTAQDDKKIFATQVWSVAAPDAQRINGAEPSPEQYELACVLERMAIFFLRRLEAGVPSDHPARLQGLYQHYFGYASHTLSCADNGKLPLWSSQWKQDSADDLSAAYQPYLQLPDVRLLKTIGDNIIEIATGHKQAMEVTMQDGLLSNIYEYGLGFQEHTAFLARMVKQIVHRYPHLNILEVGAGTGGATKKIFREVGQRFASYTYTDISSGFFETAQTIFPSQSHKMVYRVLDISKDISEQGFNMQSYDLVIASAVLHATPKLAKTLTNVRHLLKPGGFLVAMEPLPYNVARMGTIFGSFSGWWLGVDDGRSLSPCIHLADWDKLLRATAFSGCDTATQFRNSQVMPMGVFVSQAVDDRIKFIRDPLSTVISLSKEDTASTRQELVLLGGRSLQTSKLLAQVKSSLQPQWGDKIRITGSLTDLSSMGIHSEMTILSVLEVEQPLFKELDDRTWETLKSMLQEAGPILWVSSGRQSEKPYANMMIGLLRSAKQEIPTLDIQCFDCEDPCFLEARELSETLLRLRALTMWHRRDGIDSLLMTLEPELIRQPNGSLMIPRLYEDKEMNDRYNSSRRSVTTHQYAFGKGKNIAIAGSEKRTFLYEVFDQATPEAPTIELTHSLRSAIRVHRSSFMYLVLGWEAISEAQVIALTSEHKMTAAPATQLSIPEASVPVSKEALFVALLAYNMLASIILTGLPEGATVIIHEPKEIFAAILADEAKRNRIQVVFTTIAKKTHKSNWLTLHPMATLRALRAVVPPNTVLMVNLSTENIPGSIASRLRAVIPGHCDYQSLDTVFSVDSTLTPSTLQMQGIHTRLTECVTRTLAQISRSDFSIPTVSLHALSLRDGNVPDAVIDWSSHLSDVPVEVQPADSQIQLSSSKTYWLAGLSGSLGLLLCEWMIRHGARYITISSRNPKIEEAWLNSMHCYGATVKVFSCDMTDKEALCAVYKEMQSTLPAVAGVCQGAMVLEDTAIRNMSLEALLKVTRPKVEGSLHLEALFQSPESKLDFFVFFSSVGSMIGRVGQGNYAAANLFMAALAEQRRRRSQVASIMHIGPILGVGYIHQQGLDRAFSPAANQRISPLCEQDFFQHFAEAILAGRSGSHSDSIEVTTGLTKFEAPHETIPFLSHYIQDYFDESQNTLGQQPKVSLKSRLADAQGRAQVARVIQEALLQKLSALFQIELSELKQADPNTLRLDELGIDSLIAVELRSFFINTLQVNIPVLRILNGAIVTDLVRTVVEMIPQRLVPKMEHDAYPQEAHHGEAAQTPGDSAIQRTEQQSNGPTLFLVPQKQFEEAEQDVQMILDSEKIPVRSGLAPNDTLSTSEQQRLQETESKRPLDLQMTYEAEKESSQSHNDSSCEEDSRLPGSPYTLPTTPGSGNSKHVQNLSLPSYDNRVVKLSFTQSLFWFSAALTEDPTSLNLTATFRLTGKLDIERLKSAVLDLGQQHESLRTRFMLKDGEPVQGIMDSSLLSLEHVNVQTESEMVVYADGINNHVYDLEKGDTVRFALVSLAPSQHFVIIGVHHLAMDGQSFFPLMKDMMQHYTRAYEGMTAVQYADYSAKQYKQVAANAFESELAWWKSKLAEIPPILPILRTTTITSRPKLLAYGNHHVDVKIGGSTKLMIHALCRRCRATPFHFYMAVFRVLLLRYSGSEDFSIGIGDANRTEDLMGSIGDFVNILPLVFHTTGLARFDEILQETRSNTYATLANSRVPFQLLLNELNITRSAVTTPIFQAFMDYRLARGESLDWGEYQLDLLSFWPSKLAYDVAVDMIDNPDGECHLTFIVRDDLYDMAEAKQLAGSYVCLVNALAAQPDIVLNKAAIFDDVAIEESLDLGRGPLYQPRNWGDTVIHRIDSIAQKYPERTAVISGGGVINTYDEIVHRRVDAIAIELLNAGVTTGSRVAVLQESTPDWVSSILAIMRIGASFVPLDIGMPLARHLAIVNDCQPQAILVDNNTRGRARELGTPGSKIVSVSHNSGRKVPNSATSGGTSTILYTSGSSGTPKGIVLTHRGISSWLEPCGMLYGMKPAGEVVLQQSSQGFDMALMQIFTALCFGGRVYLLPQKLRGDARAISDIIARFGITQTYGTPSEYYSWLRFGDPDALRLSSWKTALVGGEALASSVLEQFAALEKDGLRFHHMYGTTESTFCAAVVELDYMRGQRDFSSRAQQNYPAGIVLPNYNIYILDDQRQPLPIGFQGEIYIGGAGVAQGYLNNLSMTAATFVTDSFATVEDLARGWSMMQRTGDLGRWSSVDNGTLIIEGRISDDTMIKLNGLRVDLREVEHAILRAGAGKISEASVSCHKSSSESPEFLVAHVVVQHGAGLDRLPDLRAQLGLPLYMQPAFIMALDILPTTPNGKRDRKAISALPLPKKNIGSNDDVSWTSTESILRKVWEDVLPVDVLNVACISPETDFFHVGGTSLLLLPLREKIKMTFGVELQLLDLFDASVLSDLAHRIEGQTVKVYAIDWDKETSLRACMTERGHDMVHRVSQSHSKIVVMTGGSGYLGKALIHAMIQDTTVREIHCLGVRNVASRNDLRNLVKVQLYEGDLCQPRIGMSQSAIDQLFERADLIIHNGSDISYLKTYRSIRQSNFLTTKDLVEWSMPRMIPFHFISTAGIGNLTPEDSLKEASVASSPPPTDGSHAYTACKWASEVFLEKVVERFPEWPVYVHRPTLISRDDIPQLDGMHNILGYARKMGAVPMSKGIARGTINVVQLETVVTGVLGHALSHDKHHPRGEVQFLNHRGSLNLPINNMKKWALKKTVGGYLDFSGVELEEIPMDEWIRRAGELGMHPTMSSLLDNFARGGEVDFPVVAKGSTGS